MTAPTPPATAIPDDLLRDVIEHLGGLGMASGATIHDLVAQRCSVLAHRLESELLGLVPPEQDPLLGECGGSAA